MQHEPKEKTSHPLPNKIHTSVGAEVNDDERGRIHLCHGYDLYNDVLERYSWPELTYLHIKGELPSKHESAKFDFILRSVINPGPTDWATQAAMTAAVTHTPVGNSLLAGLAVLQGRFHGALAVEKAMEMLEMLTQQQDNLDNHFLSGILKSYPDVPGFDRPEKVNEERIKKIISLIPENSEPCNSLQVALQFASKQGMALTKLGLFAAVLCDLGFSPRQGHGLYLIASAPGILAHLLEQMEGNWTSYPFGPPLEYVGPEDRDLSENQRCYTRHNE